MRTFRLNISLLFFLSAGFSAISQTNPTAQTLPYSQDFASFTGSTTTYPSGWQGWTITGSLTTTASTTAPNGDQALTTATNATTGSGVFDMVGKMGLLSTGSALKSICLAINTSSLSSVNVSFLAQTQGQTSGGRIDELLLQYRVGTSGSFTSIAGATYQNNASSTTTSGTAGTNGSTVSIILPSACDNQPVVQLRWEMRDVSGSGNRPSFSIDDISVSSCNTPTTQASNITFSSVYGTSMTVNWTNGNGSRRIVKMNTSNSFSNPVNGTSYSANSVYGGGEQVVYNGTSNTVSVTGLTMNTTYWFRVYEYNCTGTNSNYLTTTATNNPLSQITCNGCTSPGDYFRSLTTGNWSAISSWESSPDNLTWYSASLVPTSAAISVTILNSHTITIDANASAPLLTINSGGTLQANSSSFVTLTITGNLVNDGTLQMVNGTKGVDLVFSKNGSQSITGSGATTNFYSIGLNMGSSRGNYLDISPANFTVTPARAVLFNSSSSNALLNGTVKFSGSYTWTGTLFQTGASYAIASTAGIWLNNSNVTILGSNDSYDVSGMLRISAGTFNVGTSSGNSIRLLNNCRMEVLGGTVNVASRIQGWDASGTFQSPVTYSQSGGTVVLCTAGQNTSSSIADFDLISFSDSLIMSGGTMIFRNEATVYSDVLNYATCAITGGTFQFGDASTLFASQGFEIEQGGGSYMPSLSIDNSSGLNPLLYPGTDIIVKGSITIGSGTTLECWHSAALYYNFSLTKNWNNFGTFTHYNQKKVTFNGTTAQYITGSTPTNFNSLTINNSSGGVTLSTPASVNGTSGVLTLTNGHLFTTSTNILSMTAGTSVSGVNNNSFVDGPMKKTGASNFTFPVGKDLKYRSIAISSLSASETFTAEYFHSDPDAVPYDVTLKDPTLDDIGRCEYWILNRAGTANANVTLSWDTYSCGVTSLPDLAVARWDSSLGMWKDQGNGGTTGTTALGTVISNGLVTSFSPFTLASKTTAVNPLPVELVNFSAAYNPEGTVDLKWQTASEKNNDYFTIERSEDALSFTGIIMSDGAGNSDVTRNYSAIDDSPLPGVSYYRLKQTDFDGNFKYSNTVSVQKTEEAFDITGMNSANGMLDLYFNCSENCQVNIELYDLGGKKVYSSFENVNGRQRGVHIPVEKFSKGIYLLKAGNGSRVISRKVKL